MDLDGFACMKEYERITFFELEQMIEIYNTSKSCYLVIVLADQLSPGRA